MFHRFLEYEILGAKSQCVIRLVLLLVGHIPNPQSALQFAGHDRMLEHGKSAKRWGFGSPSLASLRPLPLCSHSTSSLLVLVLHRLVLPHHAQLVLRHRASFSARPPNALLGVSQQLTDSFLFLTFPLMRRGSAAAGGSLVNPATLPGVTCCR